MMILRPEQILLLRLGLPITPANDLGGGSESSSTTVVPPKTDTELQVDALTLAQLQRQDTQATKVQPLIDQYIADQAAQAKADKAAGITPQARAELNAKSFLNQGAMDDINMELAKLNLASVKNAGKPTPEQLQAINDATSAAQATGEADIDRFRTATLRQINEEVASASGLRPTDTPILRLSERAGEESARQQGMLTSRLAETNATARLNYPLASQKLISDISSNQQSLSQAASDFTQQLNMRAQDNRYRLFAGGQAPPSSAAGFGSTLANQRLGAASHSGSTENDLGLAGIGKAAGGIGSLISAGSVLFSDRRLKKDIIHLGALASGIPVYAFRYVGFEPWYVGVMADEVLPVIPEAVEEDASGYLKVNYARLH